MLRTSFIKTVVRLSGQPYKVVGMFEDHIGLCELENKKVVIKTEPGNIPLLKYEYEVLKKLIHLGVDWVPQVYGYYEDTASACIIMEHINGVTATRYLSRNVDWKPFIKATLDILEQMNTMKITHYDFHSCNMIVATNPFKLYIIDWAYSHCPEVDPTNTELSIPNISTGMVPTCFDDIYDLSLFISSLTRNCNNYLTQAEAMRRESGFLSPWRQDYYRGREDVSKADLLYGTKWNKCFDLNYITHSAATEYKQVMLSNRKYQFTDLLKAVKSEL